MDTRENKFYVAAVAIAMLAVFASADIVGTNPVLDNPANDFYIPLKLSSSGTLGVGGVGLTPDSIKLYLDGAFSVGYVDLVLSFDLSSELAPGYTLLQNSAILTMVFEDIDFKPDTNGYFILKEMMTITFLRNASDTPPIIPDLTINESNYENFAQGTPPIQTDNTTVTYDVGLLTDLNLSAADFAAIEADQEFGLAIRFGSHITHTRNTCHGDCTSNTPEDISGTMSFGVIVPEPTTFALVAFGGGLVMLKRKHK